MSITHIKNVFDRILVELRQNHKEKFDTAKALTSEIVAKLFANLPKNTNKQSIRPEQIVDAIARTAADEGELTKEQLDDFKNGLIPLFPKLAESMMNAPNE